MKSCINSGYNNLVYDDCFDGFVDGVFSPMREHTDSYGSSAMSPLDSVSRQSAGTIGISNITPLRSDLSSLKNVCYFSVWTLAKLYQNFAFSEIILKKSACCLMLKFGFCSTMEV